MDANRLHQLCAIIYLKIIHLGDFIETRSLTPRQCAETGLTRRVVKGFDPASLLYSLLKPIIGAVIIQTLFRTLRCGLGRPTDYPKPVFWIGHVKVQQRAGIARLGMAFRDTVQRASILARFVDHRDVSIFHGIGSHGETPFIGSVTNYETYGRDTYIVSRLIVSFGSSTSETSDCEGVKIQDEILITEVGGVLQSQFPYEDNLLDVAIL